MYKLYLLLVLMSSLTNAQTLDFNEVLDLTLNNSKDLKNQKLDIDLSKLDIHKIDSVSYGKLSFEEQINRTNHAGYVFNSKLSSREATFNDFGAAQYDGTTNSLSIQPENLNYPKDRNNFNTKLNYDIPLFTGFKLTNQKEILKLKKKVYELKHNQNTNQLSYEVLKSYNAAVVAKEFIQATKKAKESILQVRKTVNAFYKEGLVTKIDVKQAKVYELNINSKLSDAQNKFDLALAYLKFLSSNDKITDVKELKYVKLKSLDFNTLYENALVNKHSLKMQNLNKEMSKKSIDIANSKYYPTVYSHLEYGFNDDKLSLSDDKDYYYAMIGLKYTLFDGTRNIDKQKSQIQHKQSILNYEKLKDYTKLEIQKELLNLKLKEKTLIEKKEALVLSIDIYNQSKLMYKNQLIPINDLLKEDANLRYNQANVILARYEKSLALANLNLISGNSFIKKTSNINLTQKVSK